MPIVFPRGLTITTDEVIDSRLVLTKEQMATIENDFMMPEHYFCLCSDDSQFYTYDSKNTVIVDPKAEYFGLGRFRPAQVELEAGNGISLINKDFLELDLTELSEQEFEQLLNEQGTALLNLITLDSAEPEELE